MSELFPVEKIRNMGFIAHIDAGKTTVTEQVLFITGRTHRVGGVDEGTTVMDWMPQERERGITINSAATTCSWNDYRVNIIDTPGHVDFTAEVERSLRVLDGGVVVLDAVAGVQPQSETVWRQADRYHVPRICFVNKMDRVGADFDRTLDTIRHRLKANPVPIQCPMGEADSFNGIIDLLGGRALVYKNGSQGDAAAPEESPMPEEYRERYEQYREIMLEKIVETDDDLMARYLDGGDIKPDELMLALRYATLSLKVVPVLCGTALRSKGIQPLLDAIVNYLPSPIDVPPVEGLNPETSERMVCEADAEGPLAALVYKVATDPFVGRLAYLRVYSGTVKAGSSVYNITKGSNQRVGRVLMMHANRREEVNEIAAGNICGVIGLKDTFTGDTITDKEYPVILEPPHFPSPVISVAIEPVGRADQEKLSAALRKLAEEDPTFTVRYNDETGQTVISGMGELHLEVLVDRMFREFNVSANVGKPRVSYREAITRQVRTEGRFVRQTGGHGQYGHVWLEVGPRERGEGFLFENKVVGGNIPKVFISAVEKGVKQALENGPLLGFPVIDVKVVLVDGSHHPVDSSELAFNAAGSIAAKAAISKAKPIALEPIMDLEVITPGEYLGEVLGDLGARRARIKNIEGEADLQTVHASVPLSEVFGYATSLRSMTQGRSTYTMEFMLHERVPAKFIEDLAHGR